MSSKLVDGLSKNETLQAAAAEIESIMKYIEKNISKNKSLTDKERQVGPYINNDLTKILFSLKAFS